MTAPSLPPVLVQWGLSADSGWGVNGLNLVINWIRDGICEPVCSNPVEPDRLALSPLERRMLDGFITRSRGLVDQLQGFAGQQLTVDMPVLVGMGNELVPSQSAGGAKVTGKPLVAICYLEETDLSAGARRRAAACAEIVAGSSFVQQVLEGHGIAHSRTVIQGVDPTHFHPAPKSGWFGDRFVVFSGGKPEYRKGQDLVLLAFRAFARRHPEALLLSAWYTPWPGVAATLNGNPAMAPLALSGGQPDLPGWAAANGIAPDQFIDLGYVPNRDMARILREADVGLFPNRCEGGTNLVAMECMACGVPAILSANSGHLDIIGPDHCLPLTRQRPVAPRPGGTRGWGESDVEEMVEALETVWRDRAAAAATGARGAAFMAGLTWQRYARGVAEAVARHL